MDRPSPLSSACPVPVEQQPLNEYEHLRESWFFRWATRPWPHYLGIAICLWGLSWLIAGPVAAASFPIAKYPLQFCLSGAGGASVPLVLALTHLYLGWKYVRDRLASEQISYEESGWYDGQLWPKPTAMRDRDRLVVTYQIDPLLGRLQWTFVGLGGLWAIGVGLWWLGASLD
ncbi:CGLD27 family protein [Trichothermofontia sichuanensis B231]|uniref:CGLD27 family protein n=1 Tax=Trichothermofontia sichuanensis TaxID=3045816 RepID=UPI0022485FA4|nr:CGLD27 family protein [Trichothermofontia sichuanensis]UZQ55214.1 CGLD27 family protein [Trichothermofontia sichuanensis B231]